MIDKLLTKYFQKQISGLCFKLFLLCIYLKFIILQKIYIFLNYFIKIFSLFFTLNKAGYLCLFKN